MASVKISSKVEEKTWNDLKALADESHRNISGVLTEAIEEYLQRRRIRPEVKDAALVSISDNQELGELLAK
jgi:predicted transcriptional regulator